MKRYINVYIESLKIIYTTAFTYRFNFILGSLITLLSDVLFPLMTILIYRSGASFDGWTMYEVLLIQSIFTMSMAVADMFFHGLLWATMSYVREGNFEMILLMPIDSLFLLMARNISVNSIFSFLGGFVIFILSLSKLPAPSGSMWLQFLGLFIVGLMVLLGVALFMAATSFQWVGNSRIPEIFDSFRSFGKYPQSIFPKGVRVVAAFVIPVAMIGYFPASALLGKSSYSMLIAILPCTLFMLFGIFLYRYMVRLYQGVGG